MPAKGSICITLKPFLAVDGLIFLGTKRVRRVECDRLDGTTSRMAPDSNGPARAFGTTVAFHYIWIENVQN